MMIFVVILMLFGAKSIPTIARTLGRGMRQIKDATNEIQRDIRDSSSDFQQEVRKNNVVEEFKKEVESTDKTTTEN